MPRVKPVKEVALAHDPEMSISKLHFAAGISMGAARRYWYGTRDGTENGEPMTVVDLPTIARVATAVGRPWKDLVEDWLALCNAPAKRNTAQRAGTRSTRRASTR